MYLTKHPTMVSLFLHFYEDPYASEWFNCVKIVNPTPYSNIHIQIISERKEGFNEPSLLSFTALPTYRTFFARLANI